MIKQIVIRNLRGAAEDFYNTCENIDYDVETNEETLKEVHQ